MSEPHKVEPKHELILISRLTALPIFIASLCCLVPVTLVALGLSSVTFAASLTSVLDGKYRWLFILAGLLSLCVSVFAYLRRQNICTLDQAKRRKKEVINILAIIFITTALGYVLFFYLIVDGLGHWLKIW